MKPEMKLFDRAIKKAGSLSDLQHVLAQYGVKISRQALWELEKKPKLEKIRVDLLTALGEYVGNWEQLGKDLSNEYLKK